MTNEAKPQADTCPRANGEAILKPQIPQITHKNLIICEDKSQTACLASFLAAPHRKSSILLALQKDCSV
jgi:hypothetical protein